MHTYTATHRLRPPWPGDGERTRRRGVLKCQSQLKSKLIGHICHVVTGKGAARALARRARRDAYRISRRSTRRNATGAGAAEIDFRAARPICVAPEVDGRPQLTHLCLDLCVRAFVHVSACIIVILCSAGPEVAILD